MRTCTRSPGSTVLSTTRSSRGAATGAPSYVVAFDGSFRYRLIEELDPEGFARIRDWIRRGRWTVGGAFIDAADVNLPHPESLVRHALLAIRYFADRFAVRPRDVFLPDCFGFGFALPSVAAHCGLVGFSSQKLSRGRIAGRLPFELGVWEGVDGSAVLAALDPGGYGEMLRSDLSHDTAPLYERERSGVGVAMRYFGVGDTGGAPGAETLAWLERSRAGAGPVEVRVGASGQLFEELSDEEVEALPRHRGELLMRLHGPGCYSAKAVMKRWNRLNERRARSAEIAACGAAALGLTNYPQRKLNQAWERFLWHQFHDDLTGTSVPAAYDYSIADERLSFADFTDVLAVGLRALGSALDTTMGGVPVVVWNASSRERAEIVEAEITLDHDSAAPLVALNAEGQATFCQVLARQGRRARIAFPARLRGLSVEAFEILEGLPDREPPEGETTSRRLARPGISVELDSMGRLTSLRTEFLGECLAEPVELELAAQSLEAFSRLGDPSRGSFRSAGREVRRHCTGDGYSPRPMVATDPGRAGTQRLSIRRRHRTGAGIPGCAGAVASRLANAGPASEAGDPRAGRGSACVLRYRLGCHRTSGEYPRSIRGSGAAMG